MNFFSSILTRRAKLAESARPRPARFGRQWAMESFQNSDSGSRAKATSAKRWERLGRSGSGSCPSAFLMGRKNRIARRVALSGWFSGEPWPPVGTTGHCSPLAKRIPHGKDGFMYSEFTNGSFSDVGFKLDYEAFYSMFQHTSDADLAMECCLVQEYYRAFENYKYPSEDTPILLPFLDAYRMCLFVAVADRFVTSVINPSAADDNEKGSMPGAS